MILRSSRSTAGPFLAVLISVVAAGSAVAHARRQPSGLRAEVAHSVNRAAGRTASAALRFSSVRHFGSWFFGEVVIPPPAGSEGAGIPVTFIARRQRTWRIALQHTRAYQMMLRASPRGLLP